MSTENAQAASGENQTGSGSQENQNQGASGDSTNQPAQAAENSNSQAEGGNDEQISLEAARKLRSESASLRQRLAAAEKKAKEYEDKELSEAEKAKRDLEEANKKIAENEARARSYQVRLLAKDLGIVDPEAAEKLIDWTSVEDTDAARTTALKELVKARPWLGQGDQQHATTSATSPARTQTNPTIFTKSQIADRDFWRKNEREIMKAMAEGRIVEG